MTKYITKASAWDDLSADDYEPTRTIAVIVEDDAVDTGLLNADGTKIYRVRDRVPVGFRGHTTA